MEYFNCSIDLFTPLSVCLCILLFLLFYFCILFKVSLNALVFSLHIITSLYVFISSLLSQYVYKTMSHRSWCCHLSNLYAAMYYMNAAKLVSVAWWMCMERIYFKLNLCYAQVPASITVSPRNFMDVNNYHLCNDTPMGSSFRSVQHILAFSKG